MQHHIFLPDVSVSTSSLLEGGASVSDAVTAPRQAKRAQASDIPHTQMSMREFPLDWSRFPRLNCLDCRSRVVKRLFPQLP